MRLIYIVCLHSTILTALTVAMLNVTAKVYYPLIFLIIASGPALYPIMGGCVELIFASVIFSILFLARKKILKSRVLLFFLGLFWCFWGFLLIASSYI